MTAARAIRICGGYSDGFASQAANPDAAFGKAYLVDYNAATGRFSHWKSFTYPSGGSGTGYSTHFHGISGVRNGIFTISADSQTASSDSPLQGSFLTVKRNPNGTFGAGKWISLDDPNVDGPTSAHIVFGRQVVGIVITSSGIVSYQATV